MFKIRAMVISVDRSLQHSTSDRLWNTGFATDVSCLLEAFAAMFGKGGADR